MWREGTKNLQCPQAASCWQHTAQYPTPSGYTGPWHLGQGLHCSVSLSQKEDNRLDIPRQMKYAVEVLSTWPYHLQRLLVPSSSASFKLWYSNFLARVSQCLIRNSKLRIVCQMVDTCSLENICCVLYGSLGASQICPRWSQSLGVRWKSA